MLIMPPTLPECIQYISVLTQLLNIMRSSFSTCITGVHVIELIFKMLLTNDYQPPHSYRHHGCLHTLDYFKSNNSSIKENIKGRKLKKVKLEMLVPPTVM